jgi:L-alanine-DL-glutamate epimerase-like enolase superfamily enzyme
MKITGIETFVLDTGFTRRRPWLFSAIRTDAGLTGYGEFGCDGITRGLVGLVDDLGGRLLGKDLNEAAARTRAWTADIPWAVARARRILRPG